MLLVAVVLSGSGYDSSHLSRLFMSFAVSTWGCQVGSQQQQPYTQYADIPVTAAAAVCVCSLCSHLGMK